jgi:TRAP-type mannitol/chloroaromatic compound transport system permease large subunit
MALAVIGGIAAGLGLIAGGVATALLIVAGLLAATHTIVGKSLADLRQRLESVLQRKLEDRERKSLGL